jgi:hypothetical protein
MRNVNLLIVLLIIHAAFVIFICLKRKHFAEFKRIGQYTRYRKQGTLIALE